MGFRTRLALPIALAGGALSLALGKHFYDAETAYIQQQFELEVDARALAVDREILRKVEALYSLEFPFREGPFFSEDQFQRLAKPLLLRQEGILALEWVPRVLAKERADHEKEARYLHGDYEITEQEEQGVLVRAEDREVHFPVLYVAPEEGNERALGFDLASKPQVLSAIQSARDTGGMSSTGTASFGSVRGNGESFLVVLPVYHGDPANRAERRENLKGFVVGVMELSSLLAGSASGDGPDLTTWTLVDESDPEVEKTLIRLEPVGLHLGDHEHRAAVTEVPDRDWSLAGSPSADYFAARRTLMPYSSMFTGLLFTLVSVLFLRSSKKHAESAQEARHMHQVNRTLEKLSRTDGLTGIANRRAFDETFHREWRRAIREGQPISLLLLDIDFFKLFNDQYGHFEGDVALRRVAVILCAVVSRPGDLVARYGGEEFAILLSNTDEGANVVAERCREAVEGLQIPHEVSKVAPVITACVGLATMRPSAASDPNDLLGLADQALYLAKRLGKNRVEVAGKSEERVLPA